MVLLHHWDSCRIHTPRLRSVECFHDVCFCWLWDSCRIRPSRVAFGWVLSLHCVLIQSLCYDLHDGGAPHMSTCVYVCRRTCESRTSMVLPEVMIIEVGMGVCMPTGTCHRMSMGRVG